MPSAHAQFEGLAQVLKAWVATSEARDARHDQAMDLIVDALAAELSGTGTYGSRADWQRPAELLALEGSTHPLILFAVAYSSDVEGDGRKASREYSEALQALSKASVPESFRLVAATRAAVHEDSWGTVDAAKPYHIMQRDSFLALLAADVPPDRVERMAEIGMALIEAMQPDIARDLALRLEDMENVDPWLREAIIGAYEMRAAWDERGGGYASTVSHEQLSRFASRLERAYVRLHRAWQLNPSRPQAATRLVTVTMGGGAPTEETCRMWFDRALAAQPDFEPAFQAMLWAMRPRWGGSFASMYEVGTAALEGGRFETQAPMMYAKALLDLTEEGVGLELLASPEVRARLDALADGYTKAGNTSNRSR
ncbi:MAG: hypothetical protein JNK53_05155, partial [Phycisphaerae bacterium]|nr:hypothetical protein [Phycisphaerae bacterium]